ncbi:MAG: hypothetical protein FWD40_11765 [Treponema sp.]|nr:hypothetical protein [Treponema sp.]
MCDTMCVFGKDGIMYFGKNSDRSPNEPLLTIHVPAKNHAPGSRVCCTYISIPQVEYTRSMILFKPSWMWGAEMGINESRVAIGNEAVFTRHVNKKPSLTGMDMLRLALERADNAKEAIEILIFLLESYGQGGNCGFDHQFFYDNSFLVADPQQAYVLETSGKNYAVIKVEDRYAISNRLTIGKNHIMRSGKVKPDDNFSKRFTEPVYSFFSAAKARRRQVLDQLGSGQNAIEAADIIKILRSHNPGLRGKEFSRGSVGSVCMHSGGLVGDHTTGSVVAVLRREKPVTLWCTGASTPCISAFKPVFWPSCAAPVFDESAADQSLAYWLKRERIHRAVIAGKIDVNLFRERIAQMESEWHQREEKIMSEDDYSELAALSRDAACLEQGLIDELYTEDWHDLKIKGRFARYWKRKNKALGV